MSLLSYVMRPNIDLNQHSASPVADNYLSSLEADINSAKSAVDSYSWLARNIFDNTGYQQANARYNNALALYHSARTEYDNRRFQAEMSNSAYQRAVEDLKKAGLNPYLAYSNGGASTPVGSSSARSVSNAPVGSTFGSIVGQVASSSIYATGSVINTLLRTLR